MIGCLLAIALLDFADGSDALAERPQWELPPVEMRTDPFAHIDFWDVPYGFSCQPDSPEEQEPMSRTVPLDGDESFIGFTFAEFRGEAKTPFDRSARGRAADEGFHQSDADARFDSFSLWRDQVGDQRTSVDLAVTPVEYFQLEDERGLPRPTLPGVDMPELTVTEELELLKQRLDEMEITGMAREDATRTIIRQSFAERGANMTDAVMFGGTLEVLTFWADDFDDVSESDIVLDTAEIDFEIQVNDWVLGSLVFEYDNGGNFIFPTTEEDEVAIDRATIRQAWVTIGNTANYPLFTTLGRDVVPFGISTGDPVADVLTIVDPLTVEIFETTEDFILIGFAAPTCCPPPLAPNPPPGPPPVRPMFINPLVRKAATCLCSYCPCYPPTPPGPPPPLIPSCVPPYSGAIYFYNGDTIDGGEDHIEHIGGTLGYRTNGVLPYQCIPWSLDFDVDVNSSVFDSEFLQFEYRAFLDQIGYVPGMAAHVKSNFGPTALVLEWNGALTEAQFTDDVGTDFAIRPRAWQVSWAYQFGWNRSVEVIGAQGTYFVIGYSESQDMAGVTRSIGDPLAPTLLRVGNAPERRLSVGMGEWVLDGLRVAVEYSHAVDYSVAEGGTGGSANGVFMQMTYEW